MVTNEKFQKFKVKTKKKKKKKVLSVASFRFKNKPLLHFDESRFLKPQQNLQQLKLENSKNKLTEFYEEIFEKNPKKTYKKSGLRGIKTSTEIVQLYVDQMISKLIADETDFLEALAKPVFYKPINLLKEVRELPSSMQDVLKLSRFCPQDPIKQKEKSSDMFDDIDEESKDSESDDETYLPVLSVELYLNIERNKEYVLLADSLEESQLDLESNTSAQKQELKEDQSMLAEWENIHNKVCFDAFNEALDDFRPYGRKGAPAPWSNKTRDLTYRYS